MMKTKMIDLKINKNQIPKNSTIIYCQSRKVRKLRKLYLEIMMNIKNYERKQIKILNLIKLSINDSNRVVS